MDLVIEERSGREKVYTLQEEPTYIMREGKSLDVRELKEQARDIEERQESGLGRISQEEEDLLELVKSIPYEAKMRGKVILPEDVVPVFSGLSDGARKATRNSGIGHTLWYAWIEGADKVEGKIEFDWHPKMGRVYVARGDKDNPHIEFVEEWQSGLEKQPVKPYYKIENNKVVIYMDGFSGGGIEYLASGGGVASIDEYQAYDMIQTLTFNANSGDCAIRLHRGSVVDYNYTVYYRQGTSGAWTTLNVSGNKTTFPISDYTMQVAHSWIKTVEGSYLTCSFINETKLLEIKQSQKAVLSGTITDYFMFQYAYGCSNLTELGVPDTSNVTTIGVYFMGSYAYGCSNLTELGVPDTSNVTTIGHYFMHGYAYSCTNLTELGVPDTSNVTTIGHYFMGSYAYRCTNLETLAIPDTSSVTSFGSTSRMSSYANRCSSLTALILPKAGFFKTNNVNWSVPSDRLGYLKGYVLDPDDLEDWQYLTEASDRTLYTNYVRDPDNILTLTSEPTITHTGVSNITTTGARLSYEVDDGGDDTTVKLYYGKSDGGISNWTNVVNIGLKETGSYYYDLSTLSIGTKYYYRYHAENSVGGVWADSTGNFTTLTVKETIKYQSRRIVTVKESVKGQGRRTVWFKDVAKGHGRRLIKLWTTVKGQSKRLVNLLVTVKGQSLRAIKKLDLIKHQSKRTTTTSSLAKGQTSRYTLVKQTDNGQTYRVVWKKDSTSYQGLRNVRKKILTIFQTNRIASVLGKVYGQTRRVIGLDIQVIYGQGKRIADKFRQSIGQGKRDIRIKDSSSYQSKRLPTIAVVIYGQSKRLGVILVSVVSQSVRNIGKLLSYQGNSLRTVWKKARIGSQGLRDVVRKFVTLGQTRRQVQKARLGRCFYVKGLDYTQKYRMSIKTRQKYKIKITFK